MQKEGGAAVRKERRALGREQRKLREVRPKVWAEGYVVQAQKPGGLPTWAVCSLRQPLLEPWTSELTPRSFCFLPGSRGTIQCHRRLGILYGMMRVWHLKHNTLHELPINTGHYFHPCKFLFHFQNERIHHSYRHTTKFSRVQQELNITLIY